ncbi:MAG: hypothetical protein CMK46_07915 [Porticoccus sp.]|uniref:DUF2971 domain-containing protein n=1 Tax=Porticoccus hydrocarbonoclasticus TaxID=1073414 RepID=UPI000C4EDB49|nr:DUF2971 domain-containing protein [Porticoccus hydrocarbonoclasticus]MBG58195.1 hypothetical protein [Porticoccus sp.]
MRLYHFLNEQYGLENMRKRRLKVARIDELNDPFEFAGVNFQDKPLRDAFRKMKREMSENRGLLCFSSKWRNPVIWSHYADRHRGLCLGFDVADESVAPVSYSGRRLAVELESLKTPRDLSGEYVRKILFTKYAHWKYENEYRGFVTLEEVDETTGLCFAEFSERLILRQVIVGAESTVSREYLSEALGEDQQNVELVKARLAFKSFSVVRQKNSKLWS